MANGLALSSLAISGADPWQGPWEMNIPIVACGIQCTRVYHETLWTRCGQSQPLLSLVAPLTTVGAAHLVDLIFHVVITERGIG